MTAKQHYNIELSRYKNAERYMNNPTISNERKLKRIPEVQQITNKLSTILQSIKDYTIDEALDGFGFEEETRL